MPVSSAGAVMSSHHHHSWNKGVQMKAQGLGPINANPQRASENMNSPSQYHFSRNLHNWHILNNNVVLIN